MAQATKELRQKFGTRKLALAVSASAVIYRKDMNFDEQFQSGPNKVETHSWVILDPEMEHPELPGVKGALIRANTYNGCLGKSEDYLSKSRCAPIPAADSKDRKKALKAYTAVPAAECPFIEVAAVEVAEESTTESDDSDSDDQTTDQSEEIAAPAEDAPSED